MSDGKTAQEKEKANFLKWFSGVLDMLLGLSLISKTEQEKQEISAKRNAFIERAVIFDNDQTQDNCKTMDELANEIGNEHKIKEEAIKNALESTREPMEYDKEDRSDSDIADSNELSWRPFLSDNILNKQQLFRETGKIVSHAISNGANGDTISDITDIMNYALYTTFPDEAKADNMSREKLETLRKRASVNMKKMPAYLQSMINETIRTLRPPVAFDLNTINNEKNHKTAR